MVSNRLPLVAIVIVAAIDAAISTLKFISRNHRKAQESFADAHKSF